MHVDRDLPDVHVGHDDVRRLAAQLERHRYEVLGRLGHDPGAHAVGARERHPVDTGVRRETASNLRAPDDHIEHPVGQARLPDQLPQEERGQRGARRRQQYDGTARGQRRSELEDRQVEGEVVAGDRRDDPRRLVDHVAHRGVGLVVGAEMHRPVGLGRLGRPAQVLVGGHPDLEVGGERDRRAHLVDDGRQQPVGGSLEHIGEPVNVPAALGAREPGPRAECIGGRADCGVDLVDRR